MSELADHAANRSARALKISVVAGPHSGTSVSWNRAGSYLVGRALQAQLPLVHDLLASMEHCRIEVNEHGCLIDDLGSRHGTIVNDSPVNRCWLKSGDLVRIGMSNLSIEFIGGSESDETVLLNMQRGTGHSASGNLSETTGTDRGGGFLAIPGYSITRKIGAGGMGIVYEGTRHLDGQRVAIKTIIPHTGVEHRSILLFRREMKVLAELEHPRIVRFIESGEFGGQIYLVMEYVDVVTLSSLLRTLSRERQIELYCGIVCQILEALEHAHERKLVHRDVKPSNILVSRKERRLHAKLADFGLAKNFEMAGLSQLTADQELRGTMAFMPPEQLQNSRFVKPTVDIYSSAATLFCYLAGSSPKPSAQKKKSLSQITSMFAGTAQPVNAAIDLSPLETSIGVREGLVEVLQRGLAFNPRQRFASAAELRQALLPFTRQPT